MSDTSFPATPRLTAQFVRAGQATQYTIGDVIANSQTAALVTPMTFTLPNPSGRLYGARFTVAPASGNMVITAAQFDLLLFRGSSTLPFAAGSYIKDNDPFTLTAAMYRELVGIISTSASLWRNTLGGLTADVVGWQSAALEAPRPFASFNTAGGNGTLIGILIAAAAWNPGNVAQTIDVTLDTDLDPS